MKTLKLIKRLLLLLCLIMAGTQSAWAKDWINKHVDVLDNVTMNGVVFQLCHVYTREAEIIQQYFGGGYHEYSTNLTNEYYASIIGINGSGDIVIPDSVVDGGIKYCVKYIGLRTEQAVETRKETYTWNFMGSGTSETTCYYYTLVETPVDVTASNVSKLTFNSDVTFKGYFNVPCQMIVFNGDVTFTKDAVINAMDIEFNGATTISQSATLFCYHVGELRFNKITHNGKINFGNSGSLTDIYYLSNIPAYSGSASNYFDGVNLGQVTAHVANKTQSECDAMHSSWSVYSSFGNVVPCTTSGINTYFSNQTFVRLGGNGTSSFITKHGGETTSYDIPADGVVTALQYTFDSGDFMRVVVTTSGEEKVEIFRDGIDVTSIFTKNGTTYTFEADDWEANQLWFDYATNVLDEAVWTIKYTDQRQIINFKDEAVKAICIANWDTNGDNELSMAEAAAVTSLGEAFRKTTSNPVSITTFDELQYFTGLTTINDNAFNQSGLTRVTLPSGITSIGQGVFAFCNLSHIAIPTGVTSIGYGAFHENRSLLSIELPQGLETIGHSAFYRTGLRSIYIPASLTSIDASEFEYCNNLVSIVVDPDNPKYDSRNNCNAIIVTAENKLQTSCCGTVVPDGIVAIGGGAFRMHGIESLVIPASVQSIGSIAFLMMNQSSHPNNYLKQLELLWDEPIPATANMFGTESSNYPKQCTLVVPAGKLEAYLNAGWTTTYFKKVVEKPVGTSPNLLTSSLIFN